MIRGLKGEQKKGDLCDGKKVYRKSKRKEICVMVRGLKGARAKERRFV